MENLKKTPLEEQHRKLGARLVPFAGFLMPVQYSGIIDEHQCVRKNAGLFDVSHMGEIRIQGKAALAAVQYLTTNDASVLQPGQAQYSLLCTPKGTVIDDLIVYCLEKDHFFLCVNASNVDKDFSWMASKVKEQKFAAQVVNESENYAQLALQGPKAQVILQNLTTFDVATIKPFHFVSRALEKVSRNPVLISRTGYTGEDGFELYCQPGDAVALWQSLLEVGKPHGIKPIGLGARDTLRLEMKYALYGNDLDEEHTALEAGLGWVVKLEKGEFIGSNVLSQEKNAGVRQKLIGFTMIDRGIPRHGYPVFAQGEAIGIVTSGTHSPSLDYAIGCAYVSTEYSRVGSTFEIEIRGQKAKAQVVKTPFYQRGK